MQIFFTNFSLDLFLLFTFFFWKSNFDFFTYPPSQPRFEAAEAVVIILLLWNLLLETLALVQYGLVVEIIALFTVTCWPLIGSAVTNTLSSSSSRSSCRSRKIKIKQKVRYKNTNFQTMLKRQGKVQTILKWPWGFSVIRFDYTAA